MIIAIGVIVFTSERRSLLHKGDTAPDFSSRLSTGETVSLKGYHGKKNVVLFFYPRDFTAGCTREVCSFRDNYDEVKKHDAELFGVSYDDEASHEAFINKYNLPFPLISDKEKTISKAYGTANRLGGLVPGAKRVTYVIDKKGVIRGIIHYEVLIRRHLEDVIEALKKLDEDAVLSR